MTQARRFDATQPAAGEHDPEGSELVLEVDRLTTEFRRRGRQIVAVDDVSFRVRRGECLGLVGESGSGKSTAALSVMNLLPAGGRLTGGSVRLGGRELVGRSASEMRRIRGDEMGMVFQDPMSALNPTMTIGRQIMEPLRLHRGASRARARARALELLDLVGVPSPRERLGAFPHQLSGGLRQRVMIAMALACEPKLLIADEPTTALDVSIQAQILDLLDDLRERLSMAVILITHDLGVVATRTDRVMVMYAGRIIERSRTPDLFAAFRHPYTEALLEAVPSLDRNRDAELYSIPGQPPDPTNVPSGCAFRTRCRFAQDDCATHVPPLTAPHGGSPSRALEQHAWACFHPTSPSVAVSDPAPSGVVPGSPGRRAAAAAELRDEILVLERLTKSFSASGGAWRSRGAKLKAVVDVSLSIRRGETFGLVGESGSGKTTVGRMAVALEQPTEGRVLWEGHDLARLKGRSLGGRRRDLQLMYQDPYSSLDPRQTVGASIVEPLTIQRLGSRADRQARVRELVAEVGLPTDALERYPHEFSGGQRQRVGLARALTLNPRLIVADEPVSALDVSVQAQILNLMRRLQESRSLTYVLISHDLSVVRYLSDRIGVMYLGKLVEVAPVDTLFAQPAHPYTQGLMEAIPRPDTAAVSRRAAIAGDLPSAINPPSGCRFRTRCPFAQAVCAEVEPPLRSFGPGHVAACHFPLATPVAEPVADLAGEEGR